MNDGISTGQRPTPTLSQNPLIHPLMADPSCAWAAAHSFRSPSFQGLPQPPEASVGLGWEMDGLQGASLQIRACALSVGPHFSHQVLHDTEERHSTSLRPYRQPSSRGRLLSRADRAPSASRLSLGGGSARACRHSLSFSRSAWLGWRPRGRRARPRDKDPIQRSSCLAASR